MGLDLIPEGCAKPGHEAEWRAFVERIVDDEALSDAEVERFQAIVIPAYERVGAPRVGRDEAANAWIFDAQKAETPEKRAEVLREFDGYHVVPLAVCDGVPKYTHGDLYDGVDKTSFRGSFLEACGDVIDRDLIGKAWGHMFPEAAIAYGQALLAAASAAQARGAPPSPPSEPAPKRGLLERLGLTSKRPKDEPVPFEDQLDIVQAAGRWYVFWGERGHFIRAWS